MSAAPYLRIATMRFRALLQYRGAALGGLFTQTFFGMVRIMVLSAFYAAGAAPLRFDAAVAYVWLGQAVFLLFPWRLDADIAASIRSGNIAYDLCRPLDLHTTWLARAIALRTAPVLLRLVPMAIVAGVVLPAVGLEAWRLSPPAGATAALLYLASFVGAVLLSAALTTLIHIGLLWTVGGEGVQVVVITTAVLLGGMVVPLPLFPDAAQPWLIALPFAGILDLPARVYTGALVGADAALVLVHQATWTVALIVVGRVLLRGQLRRITVQGG